MPIAFLQATRNALNSGAVSFRYLASFELDSGTYYFGNHSAGEYMSILGQQWYGLGGLVSVSDLRTSSGLAADEATLMLDGSLLTEVPEGYESVTSWLRSVLQEDMINRRCEIYEVIEDANTGAPIEAIRKFAGPIDGTPLNLRRPKLDIRVRSNRQALHWANGRSRSDADQRRGHANDGSLKHVTKVSASGGKLPWGYVPSSSGSRSGGSGGRGNTGGGFSSDIQAF